jgi:hypothetical protein
MKKFAFILYFFLLIKLITAEDFLNYVDKEVGYSFNYLKNNKLLTKYIDNSSDNNIFIIISKSKLDVLDENNYTNNIDKRIFYLMKENIDRKDKLNNGIFTDTINPYNSSFISNNIKILKINEKNIEINNIFVRMDSNDITYERNLLFYHNNYRIIFTITSNNIKDELIKIIPDKYIAINYWILNNAKPDEISDQVLEKSNKIFNINETVDNLIKSIKFYPKYYTTNVDKLRLREFPSQYSIVIREIPKGEKLIYLDQKNKYDYINNLKGYWVEVKTIKNEIGWCYSEYINEIK